MEYELPANDPQVFINPTFWSITATCTIHTESPASVFIRGLNKSGKVNGIPIKKDDTLTIEIHDNDLLEIVADSAAKVELTNLSEETVKATCKA